LNEKPNISMNRGEIFRLNASGFSMRPEILPGDILEIAPVPAADIRVGDIAVFKSGEHLIAHRIVGCNLGKGYFIEKGDGKYRPFRIYAGLVVGKVVALERGKRKIVLGGKTAAARSRIIAYWSLWRFKLIDSTSYFRKRIKFW